MTADEAVRGARLRRTALHESMIGFEAAVTAPAASPQWLATVMDRLEVLEAALDGHISEVDRADGIIAKALDRAPWLETHAEILRAQHGELTRRITHLDRKLAGIEVKDAAAVADMREQSYDLLRHLSRHRQDGADLVYDAYDLDIGGRG